MKKKILLITSLLLLIGGNAFAQKKQNMVKSFVVSNIPPHAYTGAEITPSITIRDGRNLLEKDVDYTLEYKNNKNAGTATVIIRGVAGGNYSESITKEFQIEKAKLVILVDDNLEKPYGYPDPLLTYKIRSGELKGNDELTGSVVRAPGETIGTYPISQGTLSAGPNYDLAVLGSSVFTITKSPITIRAVANQHKMYGAEDPILKYSIVEGTMVKDDKLTGTPSRMPGEDVGSYAITQGTIWANENYEIRFIRDHFEITRAPISVKADAQQKMYGEPDSPPLTYQIVSGKMMNGEQMRGQLAREAGEDVGTYQIKQGSLTAGNNYALTFIPNVFEIVQKPLKIK